MLLEVLHIYYENRLQQQHTLFQMMKEKHFFNIHEIRLVCVGPLREIIHMDSL